MLIVSLLLPLVGGAITPLFHFKSRVKREIYVFSVVLLTSLSVLYCLMNPSDEPLVLFHLTDSLSCTLKYDGLGRLFAGLVAILWPLATLYAFEYMKHEGKEDSFFAYYTMSYAATLGIAASGDIVTMYIFYELLTLATLPLVMHGMSHRSVAAGLKYLYYSLGGAAMAFVGVMLIVFYGNGTAFAMGGVLTALPEGNQGLLRFGYLLAFLGFGVKAAVFPFHDWLPTASVAPTPVTALLHAVAVVKAGVFAVIRATYFSFGTVLIAGTYAQYIPLCLASFTVVFGAVMAVREQHLKRRLAYSTVSNLSYILLGALLLTPAGLTGALTHMVFHALMKITLFCAAGAVLVKTNKQYVQDIRGFFRIMPKTFCAFILGALAMTGIPPLIGFTSKWLLAEAAIASGVLFAYIGLAALLISAILTAVYLLVPAFSACFSPRNQGDGLTNKRYDPSWQMLVPLALWSLMTLALSLYSTPLLDYISRIASGVI